MPTVNENPMRNAPAAAALKPAQDTTLVGPGMSFSAAHPWSPAPTTPSPSRSGHPEEPALGEERDQLLDVVERDVEIDVVGRAQGLGDLAG